MSDPAQWMTVHSLEERIFLQLQSQNSCLVKYQASCDYSVKSKAESKGPSSETWKRKFYFEHGTGQPLGYVYLQDYPVAGLWL